MTEELNEVRFYGLVTRFSNFNQQLLDYGMLSVLTCSNCRGKACLSHTKKKKQQTPAAGK